MVTLACVSLAQQLERVRGVIAAACARRGRSSEEVRLLAATKTVAPERIAEAYALGVRLFGENRVQELEAKRPALASLAAEWRLLGPLQSNKAARALSLFDAIESLNSLALAQRLDRLARETNRPPLPVLLEINIGEEPQKHGIAPAQALAVAQAVAELPHLRLGGVMAVPPAVSAPEAARPYFAALAALGEQLRLELHRPRAGWDLSMGMSHDFAVAVEEGATIVRLGSALFGSRPPL